MGLYAHGAVLSSGASGTFSPSKESPLLQPLAPLISSRLWICLFWTFIEMESYSRAGFFTQHVFRVHLFQNFLPLHGPGTFCCVEGPCVAYPSSADGHLGGFHFPVIVNDAAVNICVQGFVWTCFYFSFQCNYEWVFWVTW